MQYLTKLYIVSYSHILGRNKYLDYTDPKTKWNQKQFATSIATREQPTFSMIYIWYNQQ